MNWEKHFPILQIATKINKELKLEMMMKPRSIFFKIRANSPKVRISAKVWKVDIKFPCGFYLKENVAGEEPVKRAICQVLN